MDSYTPEQWDALSNLLADALQHPADERDAFLDAACAGDAELRAEVEELLEAYHEAEATDRFDHGALDLVPLAFPHAERPEQVGAYRLIREIGHGGTGSLPPGPPKGPNRVCGVKKGRTPSESCPRSGDGRIFRPGDHGNAPVVVVEGHGHGDARTFVKIIT